MKSALIIFAKYPEPGKVKTRLAAAIGQENACRVYKEFVSWLLERILSQRLFDEVAFAVSPGERVAEFSQLFPGADRYVAQNSAHDLGGRMAEVLQTWQDRGFQRTLIVGTDSPNMPMAYLRQALDALAEHEVVFGPAEDGGYYLVGQRAAVPGLFDGIRWSTDSVLRESLERVRQSGVRCFLLPEYYDVDDRQTLSRLMQEAPELFRRLDIPLRELGEMTESER